MKQLRAINRYRMALATIIPLALLLGIGGCERNEEPSEEHHHHADESHHDHGDHYQDEAQHDDGSHHENESHHDDEAHHHDEHHDDDASNHISVPPSVRQNLGISFVKVEKRPVQSTVRLPGQFELRPEARREYRVALSGNVHLAVKQYQTVEAGDLLYELDSPAWRRVQSSLAEAFQACFCCFPELDSARAAKIENDAEIDFLQKRIGHLLAGGSRVADLDAELTRLQTAVPRLEANIRAKEMDLRSSRLVYDVLLNQAEALTGIDSKKLEENLPGGEDDLLAKPFWSTVDRIQIHADRPGIVSEIGITDAGWADEGGLVLRTIDPTALRFHGDALQTDIALFVDGQPARISPPPGGSIDLQATADGRISVGFQVDSTQRTIPIFLVPDTLPTWAKAGVTAYLEVFTGGSQDKVPAIPEACVIHDGLDRVFFLRDSADPDVVIRTTANLGATDGRWVEIRNGVTPGSEVVLDGIYPLMLASSQLGQRQEGGHFHADGTFHGGEED